jgi:peroxiredoxin
VSIRRRNLALGAVLGVLLGGAVIRAVVSRDATSTATLSPDRTVPLTIARASKLTGKQLPDATFQTFDGKTTTFKDLAGKPVVVNVWSWSCEPCIAEMPDFEIVHKVMGERVWVVGMNSAGDGIDRARSFADKTGVTYPLWRDTDAAFSTAFKIAVLPTTIVADQSGTVVWSANKVLNADELTAKLKELFP